MTKIHFRSLRQRYQALAESMRRVLHDNLWRYEQHRSLAS